MPAPLQPQDHSARARLLHAAQELFYNDGISATGIDAIIRQAGVARQSLYNNFTSKADLVAAYIEARHAEWLALYHAREAGCSNAQARILAVFDAYDDHARFDYARGFRGCGLLNAAAELGAQDPGRAAVRRHKEEVEAILADNLRALPGLTPARAARLAPHLSYLLEGAITRAGLETRPDRLHQARQFALDLLNDARAQSAQSPDTAPQPQEDPQPQAPQA